MSRATKIEEAARAVLQIVDDTRRDEHLALTAALALPPDDERGALERFLGEIRDGHAAAISEQRFDGALALRLALERGEKILADMPPRVTTHKVTQTGEHFCETQCEVRERLRTFAATQKSEAARLRSEVDCHSMNHDNALGLLEAARKERDEWKARAEAAERNGAHAVELGHRQFQRVTKWRDAFAMPDEQDAAAIARTKKRLDAVDAAEQERDEWKARAEKAEAAVSKFMTAHLNPTFITGTPPPMPESMKDTPDALRLERDGWKMRAEAAEARVGTTTDASKDADALQAALDLVAYLIDRRNRYGEGVAL